MDVTDSLIDNFIKVFGIFKLLQLIIDYSKIYKALNLSSKILCEKKSFISLSLIISLHPSEESYSS